MAEDFKSRVQECPLAAVTNYKAYYLKHKFILLQSEVRIPR